MWLITALVFAFAAQVPADDAPTAGRIERLDRAFLEHVKALGPEQALAVGVITQSWDAYQRGSPESFVPDALAVLYPDYRAALTAFDAQRFAEAGRLLESLRRDADPYLAANARYFHARALVEQGMLEEVEGELQDVLSPDSELAKYTPYVAHLWFIRAYCEASDLKFEQAAQTLRALAATYPDAAEPVRVGARQLALEIEQRERGTLGEVADVMGYSAGRLKAADAGERVRTRQDEVVALLDKLIKDTEQQEQQQGGGRGRQSGSQRQRTPRAPLEQSRATPGGSAPPGEQHAAPAADPGQMWGKLPPAERERILQSLRDRFPSRYRQLVEQYYRSMAEEPPR